MYAEVGEHARGNVLPPHYRMKQFVIGFLSFWLFMELVGYYADGQRGLALSRVVYETLWRLAPKPPGYVEP